MIRRQRLRLGNIQSCARKLARAHGMKCAVMTGPRLLEERLVGIHTVGQASENRPCLIRLEYQPPGTAAEGRGKKTGPRRTARQRPVVLIGKTLCYDSGGLSLKSNNGRKGMKRDKDGGCAVLGAMHAIGTYLKPSRRVVAILASAENSISDEALDACRRCQVRVECLDWAYKKNLGAGYFGGISHGTRKKLTRDEALELIRQDPARTDITEPEEEDLDT